MLKLDAHIHVTPPEISGNLDKYTSKEPYFELLSASPKNKFADAKTVIAELDGAGFDGAVIFGFAFQDLGLCRMVNDYVIEMVKAYPRLTGFIAVPPADRGALGEIERAHEAGLKGVGEIFPSGQRFSIEDADATRAFTGLCAERSLPILVHANEPVGHYYPGKTDTTLRQLEQFIEHSSGVDIILAHWGGGLFFYEMMPEFRQKCARVYYDCAATPFLYDSRVYRTACDLGLETKILFGSDYPLLPISRYIKEINKSAMPPPAREMFLGGNCARLISS
ncbi:MAG: amidohydrolase family protein [Spirochaetaceae bacterium]|jgi:predicted TIM-barrel fold metal-dependent hydrolase|nr:amidohydrolase family protein [Spirochaetaceae bacterium]